MTDIDFEEPVTLPDFLSYSQMSKYNQCPQAWHYRYLRHLDQAETAPAVQRDFGSWWHAVRAADSISRGLDHGSLVYWQDVVETVDGGPTIPSEGIHVSTVLEAAGAWWVNRSEDYKAAFLDKLGQELPDRLDELDRKYIRQWASERNHERPVGVEIPLELTVSPHRGQTFRFTGFIDEIYQDVNRGFLVVRDHKTHATLTGYRTEDDLVDSQLHLYAWAAQVTLDKLPGKIRATAYDRVRSTAPKMPAVTKSGTLSKSVTDYDLATYKEWVGDGVAYPGLKKDGSGAGTYRLDPKVVEKLSTPEEVGVWYRRSLAPINRRVIKAHVGMLADVAAELPQEVAKINAEHEARRRLSRFGCRNCPYYQLCRAQLLGGAQGQFQISDFGLQLASETNK